MTLSNYTATFPEVMKLLGGARNVGGRIRTFLDLHRALVAGMRFDALPVFLDGLEALSPDVALTQLGIRGSDRRLRQYRHLPHKLTSDESDNLWVMAEMLALTAKALGSRVEAERWLATPVQLEKSDSRSAPDGRAPFALLTTSPGRAVAMKLLSSELDEGGRQ